MSDKVTITFGPAEKLMFEEVMDAQAEQMDGETPNLQEWADDTLNAVLYQNYRQVTQDE